MSATVKQRIIFDVVARELWRVAESGDVDELCEILSRGVDVNARNEHGMTALMRAARQGHTRVVETLLERGADPNSARNDRFTALALAAFFGHGEIVRLLIDHGARTEVVTRCGTSPRMWASARAYGDAAHFFEERTPPVRVAPVAVAPVRVMPAPVEPPRPAPRVESPPASPPPVEPLVVRTLKDPPEIWDLVHEAPRGFNPRSAFVERIASMKRIYALGLCALFLVVVGGAGMWVFRNAKVLNSPRNALPVQTTNAATIQTPVQVQADSAVVTPEPTAEQAPVSVPEPVSNPRYSPARRTKQRVYSGVGVVESAQSKEAPTVATPQIESPKPREPVAKSSPTTPSSPQLVTPRTAPKGKVIQWP